MAKDYKIFYLKDLSFDFIRKMNNDTHQLLEEPRLKLYLANDEPRNVVNVGIESPSDDKIDTGYQNNSQKLQEYKYYGCLSEEDGTEYIPYLKKDRTDLYEVAIIKINKDFDDLDKAVMVAIRIAETNNKQGNNPPSTNNQESSGAD